MRLSFIPTPPSMMEKSRVYELKSRLDWGEPALTIVDVRKHDEFIQGHILGAVNMPLDELIDRAVKSLEPVRDIYVYSDTDEEASEAAAKLREAGYMNVSEVQGGLPAWKAYQYPTESGAVFVA
jgi:rhodanese-related sulfurtransferase